MPVRPLNRSVRVPPRSKEFDLIRSMQGTGDVGAGTSATRLEAAEYVIPGAPRYIRDPNRDLLESPLRSICT